MEDFNSKYTGEEVEDILDQVASGNVGGGGIAVETDPVFSVSPAATITAEKMAEWDKGATAVQPKDVAGIVTEGGFVTTEDLAGVATSGSYNDLSDKPTIPSAINIAGTNYTPSGSGIIDLNQAGLYRKPSTGIPNSDLSEELREKLDTAHRNAEAYKGTVTNIIINGETKSPNDGIVDLGNIPTSIPTEVYIADFTMESLRNGMNNGGQVNCDMQALITAMNANKVILVREGEDSAYKGVHVLNGYAEDLLYFSIVDTSGSILWCDGTALTDAYIDGRTLYLRSLDDKQDALKSGENIKTINGESILGSGNITIAGGSGEKGDKGDKGDTGATGVGVQSVKQTTISNTDGGSNVVTVTLTNGTTSTFTVKNGSKGSSGSNGTNGNDGADGATFTPSVDSAGNLSWTNNKGLANPPTVNIKGPKGDKGDAGEGGGGSSGGGSVETISLSGGFGDPLIIEEMLAEKRYWLYVEGDANGNEQSIVIGGFEGDSDDGTHIRHFYAVIECVEMKGAFDVSLSLPDVVIRWSTGIPIPIRGAGFYELSITQVSEYGYVYYNAVLTSFSQL